MQGQNWDFCPFQLEFCCFLLKLLWITPLFWVLSSWKPFLQPFAYVWGSIWRGSSSGTCRPSSAAGPCAGRRWRGATCLCDCSSCGTYFSRSDACSDGRKWKALSSAQDSVGFLEGLVDRTSSTGIEVGRHQLSRDRTPWSGFERPKQRRPG